MKKTKKKLWPGTDIRIKETQTGNYNNDKQVKPGRAGTTGTRGTPRERLLPKRRPISYSLRCSISPTLYQRLLCITRLYNKYIAEADTKPGDRPRFFGDHLSHQSIYTKNIKRNYKWSYRHEFGPSNFFRFKIMEKANMYVFYEIFTKN